MTDDELLKALAELDVTRDPRWEGLTAGTLSETDQAELGALAQASAEGRAAFEAFRPLEDDAREQAVDRIAAAIARRKRSRRIQAWAVGVGSLAAVLLLLLVVRPSHRPLPAYEITMGGAEQTSRDAARPSDGVLRFGPHARPEITLRPARDVEGPVAIRCFLAQDGQVRAWDPPAQIDATGAVRIEGDRERIFEGVPPGLWEVLILVGRAGDLPADARAVEIAMKRGDGGEKAAFRMLRRVVILGGEPP
jgi:hypothetical protein